MSPIGRPHDPSGHVPPPPRGGSANTKRAAPAGPAPDLVDVVPDPEAPEAPAPAQDLGSDDEPSVEDLVEELEAVIVQRDEYLELARAKQAELANFRKQMTKRQAEHADQAAASLVDHLLPVLDALDNGIGHGDGSLVPVRSQLMGVLEKQGLARVDPTGESFDPNEHDAVAHEVGDGIEPVGDGPSVAETLRAGYRWNGRLLRAAMVRVRG